VEISKIHKTAASLAMIIVGLPSIKIESNYFFMVSVFGFALMQSLVKMMQFT